MLLHLDQVQNRMSVSCNNPILARARRGPVHVGVGVAARPGMFAAYAARSAREIELQALALLAALAQNPHTTDSGTGKPALLGGPVQVGVGVSILPGG